MTIIIPTHIAVNGTTYELLSSAEAMGLWFPESREYVWMDMNCAGLSRGCNYVVAGHGEVTGIEYPESSSAIFDPWIPGNNPDHGTQIPEPGYHLLVGLAIAVALAVRYVKRTL